MWAVNGYMDLFKLMVVVDQQCNTIQYVIIFSLH